MHSRILTPLLAIAFLAAGSLGCGGGESPTAPETEGFSRTVTGRVVDLFAGDPIPAAVIEIDGRSVSTGSDGRFSVEVASKASATAVRVSATGYHTRHTFIRGSSAVLEMAPTSFDMTAFDDVGRERAERTVRWISDPVVYVDTRGHEVPVEDSELARWVSEVETALPELLAEWSDGQIQAARVVVGSSPVDPGTRGTIVVTFDEDPGSYTTDRQAGYARIYQGEDRVIVAADVRLRFSGLTGPSAAISRQAVLSHEIGHAVGFSHMDGAVSSIMTPVIRTPVRTAFDRLAGSMLYHRPPGNTRLDKDSINGYRAGLEPSAAVHVVKWSCGAGGVELAP